MTTGRLQLLSHPSTAAVRMPPFPDDEPLDDAGVQALRAGHPVIRTARHALTAPERRCRETAAGLGIAAVIEPALRECDYGGWVGRSLADVARDDAAGVTAWLSDVDYAPHGGESHAALMARVADWFQRPGGLAGRTLAFTHISVLRAAVVHVLGAPPAAFWRISIGPLTCASFTHHGGRWLFGGLTAPQDLRPRTPSAPHGTSVV